MESVFQAAGLHAQMYRLLRLFWGSSFTIHIKALKRKKTLLNINAIGTLTQDEPKKQNNVSEFAKQQNLTNTKFSTNSELGKAAHSGHFHSCCWFVSVVTEPDGVARRWHKT